MTFDDLIDTVQELIKTDYLLLLSLIIFTNDGNYTVWSLDSGFGKNLIRDKTIVSALENYPMETACVICYVEKIPKDHSSL